MPNTLIYEIFVFFYTKLEELVTMKNFCLIITIIFMFSSNIAEASSLRDAREYLKKGDKKKAEEIYTSLYNMDRSNYDVVKGLANFYMSGGKYSGVKGDPDCVDYDKAVFYSQRMIELRPNDLFGYRKKSQALSMLGRMDEAISILEDGISADGADNGIGYAYYVLAQYYYQKKDYNKVIELVDISVDSCMDKAVYFYRNDLFKGDNKASNYIKEKYEEISADVLKGVQENALKCNSLGKTYVALYCGKGRDCKDIKYVIGKEGNKKILNSYLCIDNVNLNFCSHSGVATRIFSQDFIRYVWPTIIYFNSSGTKWYEVEYEDLIYVESHDGEFLNETLTLDLFRKGYNKALLDFRN